MEKIQNHSENETCALQESVKSTFIKQIGKTTYEVVIHFSVTSKETMNDKILRLIKNETAKLQ